MGQEIRRLKRRKQAQSKVESLINNANTTLLIHYSCESFYDRTDGKTPRVTSIAVRNLSSGQTESFSIHKIAEQRHIDFDKIDVNYDDLEREMLNEFFEFIRSRQLYSWVHWNMRDINYGFAAIEHRFRVLGGIPILIPENSKFDLSRALVDLYGIGYINHPRLESLVNKNGITKRDFLTGKEEAEAFKNKEYIKLHQSTLRKVDILANIFERTCDRTLKTNAKWFEQYGYLPQVLVEFIKEHWVWSLISMLGATWALITRFTELF
jgi:hypothetical protein